MAKKLGNGRGETRTVDRAVDAVEKNKAVKNDCEESPSQRLSHWSDSEFECRIIEQRARHAETH